jgi:Uma2 family endonuclease
MSLPLTTHVFTPEEYLRLERQSEIRHEFLDGCVYAMAGESVAHSTICFNLAVVVGSRIQGGPCRGFSPNMKVRAGEKGLYAYPDLMVVCGEPAFRDERGDVLTNPTVIFEVLSPSTEAYDRGEKFARYRAQIETLRDYVLVSQHAPRVEHHTRLTDAAWSREEIDGTDATLLLASIGCELPLSEIYSRIDFAKD